MTSGAALAPPAVRTGYRARRDRGTPRRPARPTARPAGRWWPAGSDPGPGGRPEATCPRCGSLERHRFLSLLLGALAPDLRDLDTVVEIAPSRQSTPLLDRLGARRRISLDLGHDKRAVDALASLTALPLRDGSVDLLVCYHVLEHVPDDCSAMREIARVLSPRGIALIEVPIKGGVVTEEDPSASPDERARRFGQSDHVRWYGDDFDDRLSAAGLSSSASRRRRSWATRPSSGSG